jgi:hypothetical protein
MPVPLAPVAAAALRWGIPLLATLAVTRALRTGRTDQRAEDALDDIDDGLALHQPSDRGQTNGAMRFRRTLGFGTRRFEVDAAGLLRVRIRRLP